MVVDRSRGVVVVSRQRSIDTMLGSVARPNAIYSSIVGRGVV